VILLYTRHNFILTPKIAALEEKKNEVKEELKKLRETKPVDKEAVDELTKQEKSLNDQIKTERKLYRTIIDDIIYNAITKKEA